MISGASTPIHPHHTLRQTLVVSTTLTLLIMMGGAFALLTWHLLCGGNLNQCFAGPEPVSPLTYLLLATIRPITLLPQSIFWLISAAGLLTDSPHGTISGILLILSGTLLSFIPVYSLGYHIYNRLAKPWFLTHLPKTLKKSHRHTVPLIVQMQLAAFIHKDISSLIYGLFGLPLSSSFKALVIVETPRVILFCFLYLSHGPLWAIILSYSLSLATQLTYMLTQQLRYLMRGSSYLRACRAAWHEAFCEIQTNNVSEALPKFQTQSEPILLLYGFFASRRTLTVMEKLLHHRGHEVFALNLGGLFDVFSTKGIPSSAADLDRMLQGILVKHNITKISIVAHSKGGLVAAWWLLRMGGHRYCHNLITLGSPFGGTYFTWMALVTPLGLFWKDVWQMRPHSRLLKALSQSYIPPDLKIYCMYSSQDRITRHKGGVLQCTYGHTDNVIPIPMHQYSHFQYLYKKGVMEKIHLLLSSGEPHPPG